jgi:hypothetical protein
MIRKARSVIMGVLVVLAALLGGSVTAVAQVSSNGGEYPVRAVAATRVSCDYLAGFRRSAADLGRATEQEAVLAGMDDVIARLTVIGPLAPNGVRGTFAVLLAQLVDLRVRVLVEGVSPALRAEVGVKLSLVLSLIPFVPCA